MKGKHIYFSFGLMLVNSGLSVESYQRTHDSELLFDQQKYRSTSQAQLNKPVEHPRTDPGFVVLKLI